MTRKTFKIQDLKKMVNDRNTNSTCDSKVRDGWNDVLETILMDSGNYNGFCYLTKDHMKVDAPPGIIFDPSDGRHHEYPDESRRRYH